MITNRHSTFSFKERLHYLHRFWRYRHRSEPDTVHFIEKEFTPGGVALDIGANKGIVTYFLGKQAGSEGKVVAFEPQPEMKDQIEKVARSFQLNNVEVNNIGLSDCNGVATLHHGAPGRTANMVESSSWQDKATEIETRSLDSFAESSGINHIDFIKCDVDGFEVQVLKGAEKVLANSSPKVLVEIGEAHVAEISALLKEQGYDEGEFFYKGSRYPASMTARVPYRHPHAKWRNFLFKKKLVAVAA